MQNRKC